MGARDLLICLTARGFTLTPKPDGRLSVGPSYALTDEDRVEIRAHRDELLQLLIRGSRHQLPSELVQAVTRLCMLRGDETAHLAAVLAELRFASPEQHDELTAMFLEQVQVCERAAAEAIAQGTGRATNEGVSAHLPRRAP